MTDILDEIIAHKRLEIEQQKAAISQELLINNCNEPMPRRSMRASLSASPSGIIAEFKRRSPSKGWIKKKTHRLISFLLPMKWQELPFSPS